MEYVVLETSMGDIQLELYWNHAPRVGSPQCTPLHIAVLNVPLVWKQTCKNFAELARRGY